MRCRHSWALIKEKRVTKTIFCEIDNTQHYSSYEPVEKNRKEEGQKYLLVLGCKHCGILDKTII